MRGHGDGDPPRFDTDPLESTVLTLANASPLVAPTPWDLAIMAVQ